ncbi:MAG TPA: DegV family EDD domain-containing protein [Candidatus Scatomonas pullistercoris]|uniref:DegV family EDD domain-containing protein n=1 Tax=Candidatus Scatomonas pullistercoris TaxID=2840920 RepID=A0A9D1TA95_9FIRM|nr:DegV family EDD domain-containing protein [Candidatus Scatomonas pullistercoris]
MNNLVITVESGSDMPEDLAGQYGIFIVPMYVQFGDKTCADGSFPPSEVCRYFKETGKVPKTSGSSPDDYRKVFDEIHSRWPEKKILHLAYSAVTTCSFQSAQIAAAGRDYVACLDTRHVSAGMTAAVVAAVRALEKKESWELPEAVREAEKAAGKVRMCFLPCNLTYLRAGGRCGNLTALCGNLLQIHPRIEVLEGYLRATKKYRGSMKKSVSRLIHDYAVQEELDRREVWFLRTVDVYVARIRNKFADCRSFEIVTVHGFGYKAVLKE